MLQRFECDPDGKSGGHSNPYTWRNLGAQLPAASDIAV
jgi:hypothetical protein